MFIAGEIGRLSASVFAGFIEYMLDSWWHKLMILVRLNLCIMIKDRKFKLSVENW